MRSRRPHDICAYEPDSRHNIINWGGYIELTNHELSQCVEYTLAN